MLTLTVGSCHGSNVFAEYQLGVCFWFSQCCQPGQAECTGQYRLPLAPEPPVVCGDEAKSLEPLIHPDDYAARTWRDYCEPGEGDCVDKTKYNPRRYPGKQGASAQLVRHGGQLEDGDASAAARRRPSRLRCELLKLLTLPSGVTLAITSNYYKLLSRRVYAANY